MYYALLGTLCWFVFLVAAPLAVWGVFALVERRRRRTRDDDHFRQLRRAATRCARDGSAKHNGQRMNGQMARLGQPSLPWADTAEESDGPESPPSETASSLGIAHKL